MILEQRKGMFGELTVADYDGKRMLYIGHQVQGACYLLPAGEGNIRPGPVASSNYMSGFLVAGQASPNASALMIGLGSGCGIIALLANFPGMDITVIEIDPEVVELATKYFPLLDHYQDSGRLQIVTGDAVECMQEMHTRGDHFELGFSDAYSGANEPVMQPDMFMGLALLCTDLCFNVIDKPLGDKVSGIVFDLARAGKPVWYAFGTIGGETLQNIVLLTQDIDIETAMSFKVYPSLPESLSVNAARRNYVRLLSTPIETLDLKNMST